MDTSVSDNNWGTQHHCTFYSGYIDYRRTFAVEWGEHGRQRTAMDTSLSDIIEVCGTITTL